MGGCNSFDPDADLVHPVEQESSLDGPPDGVGAIPSGKLDVVHLHPGGDEDRPRGDQRLHHRPGVHLPTEDRIFPSAGSMLLSRVVCVINILNCSYNPMLEFNSFLLQNLN